ncbi:hypothetical protein LTR78_006453 [Recurvomyces mirabilis]|uniref:Uncharacterized protein n=1 Tax=Recurvomyces mirabilis TaxID=574656 RepID=A0AAE0WKT4_9PEZI|nr:hypothetical protein LTR78_006453 [Recurvomyces mirabilis]KAK5151127.1 hypothetical protein LTS14_009623 [Recurvomyces mirabilis]
MPEKWTAETDQKLLLYALELGMINTKKLASNDVSASAVSQHLGKLRKKIEAAGGASKMNGASRVFGTPMKRTTPGKNATPKTPKSSGKRKTMSDEDDSEGDRMVNHQLSPLAMREKAERRSKTPKLYREPAVDDANDVTGGVKQENGEASESARRRVVDVDAMSDVSDFNPDHYT